MNLRTWMLRSTALTAVLMAHGALAQDLGARDFGAQDLGAQEGVARGSWFSAIRFSGDIEVGATMNPDPSGGLNFGQLFTDKANQIVLNQFALTARRDPDPSAPGVDFGFEAQGMYGMDSQFTHFLGIGDQGTTSRNSFDLVAANVKAHAAVLTPGGVDIQAGMFVTPLGYEAIDPTRNFFYSNSYIFNFGLPRKHTGVLTTTHVSPRLDLYLGYDTGVNASVGPGGGYNDDQPHVLGGFGLDFGAVAVKALSHIGPEDPAGSLPPGVNIHDRLRYLNDVVITWKVDERLTSVTELNYIRDDGLNASGGGVAESLTYPLSPILSAGLRAEVWRDARGVFVAAYPGNLDYVDAEEGLPNGAYRGGPATYGEVTLGLNIKPATPARLGGRSIDSPFGQLIVRPEIRYDRALAGGEPFGARPGTSRDQVTVAVDVVVPLSFQRRPESRDDEGEPVATPTGGATGVPGPDTAVAAPGDQNARGAAVDTAMDAAQLAVLDPRALQDLGGAAPNLDIAPVRTSPGTSAITIRGLGSSNGSWDQTPAVGLAVDDVVIGSNFGGLVDPFDVARIDVDRGPAGVLFGRNAAGGMVDVERTRPTRAWGVDLDYSLEQGYHANVEKILFNMPVGDTAGLKVFASHEQRGGYFNNIYTGDGLYGGVELTTGNLQFDWNPTPRLYINFGLTLTHQDGQGAPLALGDPLAARLLGPSLTAAMPGLRFSAYGSPYLPGVTVPLGPFQVASDDPDQNGLTSQVYSLNLSYDASIGQFTSITAFMTQNDELQQDVDGGCAISDLGGRPCPVLANPVVGFLDTANSRKYDQFTEDLRFSRDFGGRAMLTAGLFYFHDDLSTVQSTSSGTSPASLTTSPTDEVSGDVTQSRSVFANLSGNPIRRLTLGGGVRYVDEESDFHLAVYPDGTAFAGPAEAPLTRSAGATRVSRLLTKFTADYRLTDSVLIYADRSTGLRPGGLSPGATLSERIPGQTNYDPANPRANDSAYGAETDTNYEIGSKAALLGDQVTLNVTGFLDEDRGRQLTQIVATPGYGPGFNTYVLNLPKVEIKGAELELDYRPRPAPGLTLVGIGGYEDARITDGLVPGAETAVNVNGTAGPAGATFNLAGTPLERAPPFTFTLRADYERPVGPGVVDLNIGYRWTDRYALAELAGQGDYQPAFGLLDISLSYSRGFYEIIVSARNLMNQVYFSYAVPALFVHGWGDPRTAVVELRAKF